MADTILLASILIILFSFNLSKGQTAKVPDTKLPWWKSMSIYQVYPISFKDSNGDGIGDINGVTQKLSHFVDLGIDVIWFTPFFESPNEDNGYDISNYTAIDPTYGTIEDFDRLIKEMKKLGLKFMLDFVANHCSDKHIWFQKSKQNIKPYSDYFVWKDPKGYDKDGKPIPPNNWLARFSGSAWTWVEGRKQFYYHAFTGQQPDFDFRNPAVMQELKEQLRFWLNKGIDGIRIDAAKFFLEDKELRDEPYATKAAELKKSIIYDDMEHIYTTDLIGSFEVCRELKEFAEKEFTSKDGIDRVMIVETYSTFANTIKYFDYEVLMFNFDFVSMQYPNSTTLNRSINMWLANTPETGAITWVAENHDNLRITNRFGEEFVDVMNMLMTMLPGNLCIYYGQEIGMEDNIIRNDQVKDIASTTSRDPERSPMQWDDTLNAGFTSASKPWLPVNPNYWRLNVEREKSVSDSHYSTFKNLMNLRKTPVLKYGKIETYVLSDWIFAFTRSYLNETYIVVANVGTESEIVDLSAIQNLPSDLKVLLPSINVGYRYGELISSKAKFKKMFFMRPKSSLVLTSNVDTPLPSETPKTNPHQQSSSSSIYINTSLMLFLCYLLVRY